MAERRFIDDPLWRPYIFTYHVGRDLLNAWFAGDAHEAKLAKFTRLLTEQVTPSRIRRRRGDGETDRRGDG